MLDAQNEIHEMEQRIEQLEAQLRDKVAKRAAMLVRDGLDATRPQDRLKSLRP